MSLVYVMYLLYLPGISRSGNFPVVRELSLRGFDSNKRGCAPSSGPIAQVYIQQQRDSCVVWCRQQGQAAAANHWIYP